MKRLPKYYPELLFLTFFLFVGYLPRLGAADNIAPQWLALSAINLGCGVFLLLNPKGKSLQHLNTFHNLLLAFVIWGSLSLLYSINVNEAVIILSRWFNVFFLFVNITLLIKEIKYWKSILSYLLVLGLIWEIYNSMSGYIELINITNYDFSKNGFLKGVTGNKNITSASISLKVPFLFYLFHTNKNKIFRILLIILTGVTFFNLILLSSRAVYISILAYLFFYMAMQFYFNFKNNSNIYFKKSLINISIFLVPLISAILFSFVSLGKSNSASILNRVQTINTEDTSTQIRLRYYEHALKQITENPFIGTGLGNWKFKSVDYDALNMFDYVVPYHAHNDFLEIGTELGLIGMLLYLMFMVIPGLRTLQTTIRQFDENNFQFGMALLGALLVYFVDANLNFPHARVIMQIGLMFILSMCSVFTTKNIKL